MVTKDHLKRRQKKKRWYVKRRRKALNIYGNNCDECGETMPVLLQFHHCKGKRDSKGKVRENNFQLMNRIAKAGKRLDDAQLLCANCHLIANIRDGTRPYTSQSNQKRGTV